MTLADAFEAYLADVRARNLSRSTQRDYRALFRALEEFAGDGGATLLTDIDEPLLRKWRQSWTCKATTHRTRLSRLKAFFRFASDSGWVEKSPAAHPGPGVPTGLFSAPGTGIRSPAGSLLCALRRASLRHSTSGSTPHRRTFNDIRIHNFIRNSN